MAEWQREADTARRAALRAGALLKARRRDAGAVRRKLGHDVVSEVDLAAERIIVDELRAAWPDDGILAEEGGHEGAGRGRRWVVDPLDGTVNFVAGIDYFGVAIALEDDAGTAIGHVHDPCREEDFSVRRGDVTRIDGIPAPGPSARSLSDAVIALQLPEPMWRARARLAETLIGSRGLRVSGSVALDLCWVAAGRFDAVLYRRTASRWDWLAGELIVRQAPDTSLLSLGLLGDFELVAAGRTEIIGALRQLDTAAADSMQGA